MQAFAHRCTWRSAPVRASAEALIGATGWHSPGGTTAAINHLSQRRKPLPRGSRPFQDHAKPAALPETGLLASRQGAVHLHSNDRRTSPRIRLRFPLRHDSRIEEPQLPSGRGTWPREPSRCTNNAAPRPMVRLATHEPLAPSPGATPYIGGLPGRRNSQVVLVVRDGEDTQSALALSKPPNPAV